MFWAMLALMAPVAVFSSRIDASDEQLVFEEEPVKCQDSDCEFTFSKGCVAAASNRGATCTYQYKFGDALPSHSCRCAGAGILSAKYGSLDEAFAALSETGDRITLEQFAELMSKYNVPGYTAAFEFKKADTNKDGSLDSDEFRKAAGQLMAATTGGDKALGSSDTRCCCQKKVQQPDEICLNPKTMVAHSVSSETRIGTDVSAYQSSLYIGSSGSRCHRASCGFSGHETTYIGHFGEATNLASSSQGGSKNYVKFGDALYLQAPEQTYSKCIHTHCTHYWSTQRYSCGTHKHRRTCHRRVCRSSSRCQQHQQLHYCGHTNLHTGLVRYVRVGTVGSCVPAVELETKMFVSHQVCPNEMYHSSRSDPVLSMCDCNDACP